MNGLPETVTRTVELELTYPPRALAEAEAATEMLAGVKADVPAGYVLREALGKEHVGPDLGQDLRPCYRMRITYTAALEGPVTYAGSGAAGNDEAWISCAPCTAAAGVTIAHQESDVHA